MKSNTYRNLTSVCMISLVVLSFANLVVKLTKKDKKNVNEKKKKRRTTIPTMLSTPREFDAVLLTEDDDQIKTKNEFMEIRKMMVDAMEDLNSKQKENGSR